MNATETKTTQKLIINPDGSEMLLTTTTEEISQEEHDSYLEERKKEENHYKQHAEPLYCDECKEVMGYVYECDLNGSRFYHLGCKNY